jgi:hypothetical protein
MPRPPIDLLQKVKVILQHVGPLPAEAITPLTHYNRSITDAWNLMAYIERYLNQPPLKAAVVQRHLILLRSMILVNMIETFERFLKETAAVCIDHLGKYVLDDRFNAFSLKGSLLAAHFESDTLGKSLCESVVWLDCDECNDRFRKLLANPFQVGDFYLFPKRGQQPSGEQRTYDILTILWQLRHTIIHNVGVLTQSDAIKFKLLVHGQVEPQRVLQPTRSDLRYVKRFLDESASRTNDRVGRRLAELLTTIHAANNVLFFPQETANLVSKDFGISLTVAGAVGTQPQS